MIDFLCARCDEVIKLKGSEKPKVTESDNWIPGPNSWNKKEVFMVCSRCYENQWNKQDNK